MLFKNWEIILFFFVLGSCIGSFLNVLIYRLPRKLDFVMTRSFCTSCNEKISWYHNIPLIGYLVLRGKCKKCGKKFSMRYPLIEFFSGILLTYFLMKGLNGENQISLIIQYFSLCVFIVIFFIDLEFHIIPNGLNIYLLLLFIIHSLLFESLGFWALGGLIGLLFPLGVSWVFYMIRGQIGLGGGDIKLYGVLGIYLGPMGIMQNIFLSCFLGALIGGLYLIIKKAKKDTHIPFGPFIVVIASLQILLPHYFKSGAFFF